MGFSTNFHIMSSKYHSLWIDSFRDMAISMYIKMKVHLLFSNIYLYTLKFKHYYFTYKCFNISSSKPPIFRFFSNVLFSLILSRTNSFVSSSTSSYYMTFYRPPIPFFCFSYLLTSIQRDAHAIILFFFVTTTNINNFIILQYN